MLFRARSKTAHQVYCPSLQLRDGKGEEGRVDEAPAGHGQVDLALDTVVMNADVVQNLRQEVAVRRKIRSRT